MRLLLPRAGEGRGQALDEEAEGLPVVQGARWDEREDIEKTEMMRTATS